MERMTRRRSHLSYNLSISQVLAILSAIDTPVVMRFRIAQRRPDMQETSVPQW
jgi:hypothetical protein